MRQHEQPFQLANVTIDGPQHDTTGDLLTEFGDEDRPGLFRGALAQIDQIVANPLLHLECFNRPAIGQALPVPFEETENHFGRLAQFLVGTSLKDPQKFTVGMLHSRSVVASRQPTHRAATPNGNECSTGW